MLFFFFSVVVILKQPQSNELPYGKNVLVNALKFLVDNSLQIATVVADRHKQIAKYMAEILNIGMMCGTYLKMCQHDCVTNAPD